MNPPDAPRRKIRYTLGSLLAFIAGMAIMLGLCVPFLKTTTSPVKAPASHVGLETASVTSKNCTSCHAGMPAGPAPANVPEHQDGK